MRRWLVAVCGDGEECVRRGSKERRRRMREARTLAHEGEQEGHACCQAGCLAGAAAQSFACSRPRKEAMNDGNSLLFLSQKARYGRGACSSSKCRGRRLLLQCDPLSSGCVYRAVLIALSARAQSCLLPVVLEAGGSQCRVRAFGSASPKTNMPHHDPMGHHHQTITRAPWAAANPGPISKGGKRSTATLIHQALTTLVTHTFMPRDRPGGQGARRFKLRQESWASLMTAAFF